MLKLIFEIFLFCHVFAETLDIQTKVVNIQSLATCGYKHISTVNEKIEFMSKNTSGEYYKKVLLQNKPFHTLNSYHNEFLLTRINKANNVAFICQQFFPFVVINKLGLDQNTISASKTYIQVNKTNNQVISNLILFVKNKFSLEVDGENKNFPNIYRTPKLHIHLFNCYSTIFCYLKL